MDSDRDKIIKTYADHVYPGKVEFYQKYDIVLVPEKRGGCKISDANGKTFYNCHCNGGVFNLGHRNKEVIKAVTQAMEIYDIGNHHLISKPKAHLAKMIADTMPEGLNQIVYGVSGGEAIDLAIKLARGVTGKEEIISAKGGYHGHTGFALATGDDKFKEMFKPVPAGFKQVRFNSLEEMEKAVCSNTAAVILETIPATLGIVTPDELYLKGVKEICEKNSSLLILDEVQTGFGRTGKLWGFENYEVEPDMVVMGKGMSGGIYPVSATVYHEKYKDFFQENPFLHISTYGGSEIGCFAAMKVVEISREKKFLDHVLSLGKFFRQQLEALGIKYPDLGLKVRGKGLMMGLEFKDEITALFLIKLFFDNGIYVVYAGNDPKVIQFLPVLNISEIEANDILKIIETSFKSMSGG
ncbi:aminotransferase class III-fold pyridoxal phosphate-dependent enzyme [Desulfobacula sp.]|uniref:aspartate aminotransferase family protein n=1 Tax=Desulfobacula sp. TaxID=2593537 RepID=UPI00260F4449|nr:aminotransferase class III-fold pyridoxal phosphate-dependent enzyme [Desulfobacula sp.]